MTEFTADHTLDARGLKCPMPVVRTSQEIKKISVGGILELLATDPGSVADMVAWCKSTGNELLSRDRADGTFKFYIRRTK
jgi:tRNA 2-thiouridine synthesizing protein A